MPVGCGAVDQFLALRLRQGLEGIHFDTLVETGALDAVQVIAKGFGAGEVAMMLLRPSPNTAAVSVANSTGLPPTLGFVPS